MPVRIDRYITEEIDRLRLMKEAEIIAKKCGFVTCLIHADDMRQEYIFDPHGWHGLPADLGDAHFKFERVFGERLDSYRAEISLRRAKAADLERRRKATEEAYMATIRATEHYGTKLLDPFAGIGDVIGGPVKSEALTATEVRERLKIKAYELGIKDVERLFHSPAPVPVGGAGDIVYDHKTGFVGAIGSGGHTHTIAGCKADILGDSIEFPDAFDRVEKPRGLTLEQWHLGEAYLRLCQDKKHLARDILEGSYLDDLVAYYRVMGYPMPPRILEAAGLQAPEEEDEDCEQEACVWG